MRLTDFLQMTNDLSASYFLTFKPDKKTVVYPILKITLEADKCLLISRKNADTALTLNKFFTLVKNTHNRGIPLLVELNGKIFPVFGLQIDSEQQLVSLL